MNKKARLIVAIIVIVAIAALDILVDYEHMSFYVQISTALTLLSAIAGYFAGKDKNEPT
jgi:hypothetical protein